MKKTDAYVEVKKALLEQFGESYPKSKDELTEEFLYEFGAYLECPNEEDFEDYEVYEYYKYRSEQWAYYLRYSQAMEKRSEGEEPFKKAWGCFVDWVVATYFSEFSASSRKRRTKREIEMAELKKFCWDGQAKAILRVCEEKNVSPLEFFFDYLYFNGFDDYCDMLSDLCERYGIDEFEGVSPLTYQKRNNIFMDIMCEKIAR